jgi:poly(3-hydroxybutyrate) depolymerase
MQSSLIWLPQTVGAEGATMLYSIVEMQRAALMPWRVAVNFHRALLANPLNPIAQTPFGRNLSAASDLFEAMTRRYEKPEWRIDSTVINGIKVPVTIETVWSSPW